VKVLVLGGCGIQGRTALYDLASDQNVSHIICADLQFDELSKIEPFVHEIEFPNLGSLEAIPNGDAVFFTDRMGLTETIVNTGRYSLRWPGWSAFWRPLKKLGFLSQDPVAPFIERLKKRGLVITGKMEELDD
jgi:saccharopine dehydrogenase-like NADP-dependent oxidoreductase